MKTIAIQSAGKRDGQPFDIRNTTRGRVAIALADSPEVRSAPNAAAWILNVADAGLVAATVERPGDRLWISLRPPRAVAGTLAGDWQGAWMDQGRIEVQLGGNSWSYAAPRTTSPAALLAFMADLVAWHWHIEGLSAHGEWNG